MSDRLQFTFRIVYPRNDQRGHLQPDTELFHPHQGFENTRQIPADFMPVKIFIPTLEIDIRCQQKPSDFLQRLGRNITIGNPDHLQAVFSGFLAYFERIFKKDSRFGIGAGKGLAPLLAGICTPERRSHFHR
jgi:hypothetical protein